MKMDRDVNADGTGKYALVNMREIKRIGGVKGHHNPDIAAALHTLELNGLIDYGQVGTESEFFVMKLKDKFSYRGLLGYMKGVELEPEPDYEYAKAILDMAGRAGPYSPFCKLPD